MLILFSWCTFSSSLEIISSMERKQDALLFSVCVSFVSLLVSLVDL